ncbi:MAG TPA: permease-like cell division protein FtsX [Candidatus Paceibacterota bacterium]|nr:permease-like cell division protein FtsX [Candidatus Paceibacterota bacterium]
MFTVFSRIINYGFVNFWRNGWPSAATVAIMTVALLVFIGLIFFNVIMTQAVASIQDKIDISVYFKTNTPEDEILNIKQSIESLSEVKSVEYVSSDRALQIFKEAHKDDPTISQAVNELQTNPLLASLNIKAKRPDQYASIAQYLQAPNLTQYIESLSYAKNQVVIDRLTNIIENVNRGGLVLTIVMALIAGLVVFNTIRLAIYSNRDEIGIMRAVGASNALVRGPYMVEGVIAGVLSGILALIIAGPTVYTVSPYFSNFVPGLNIFRYFTGHLMTLLGYQILFGIGIGVFSSFVAVRRYLRN